MFLDDVRNAVREFSLHDFDAIKFKDALDMVEGTFIGLGEANPGSHSRERVVSFRDHSVRDYLWDHLESVDGLADAMLERAVYFEQCVILYVGLNHVTSISTPYLRQTAVRERKRDVVNHRSVAGRAVQLIDSPNPGLDKVWYGKSARFRKSQAALEQRAVFLMTLLTNDPTDPVVGASVSEVFTETIKTWEAGEGTIGDGLELLKQAAEIGDSLQANVQSRAQRALFDLATSRLHDKEAFEVLIGVMNLNSDFMLHSEYGLEPLRSEFEGFLESERDWLLEEIDDPEWLQHEMWRIREIAEALGNDISELEVDVDHTVEALKDGWLPEDEDHMHEYENSTHDESDGEEIDSIFQSLGSNVYEH